MAHLSYFIMEESLIHFTVPGYASKQLKVDSSIGGIMYQWCESVPITGEIIISFIIDGSVWYEHSVSPDSMCWFKLDNGSGKMYIQYNGTILSKVFLSVTNFTEKIKKSQHKVTCLVGGVDFSKFYAYLGRAQSITTNHKASSRVYIWEAKTREAFAGIVLYEKSDIAGHLSDVKQMKLSLESTQDINALLSARNITKVPRKYENVSDADDFSNEYRVLPVSVKGEPLIVIRFYNFKFAPPRSTEITITHDELVQSMNRITRRIKEIQGVMTIYHEDATCIKSIMLIVQNYVENLNFKWALALQTK